MPVRPRLLIAAVLVLAPAAGLAASMGGDSSGSSPSVSAPAYNPAEEYVKERYGMDISTFR